MKAKFITPKIVKGAVTFPKCQHQRLHRYANDTKGVELPKCTFSARYKLGNVNMCQRHAAGYALAYLMEKTDV